MKKLLVKEIEHKGVLDLELAEKLLENSTGFQVIETLNWPEYPYKPEVKFKIAYCQDQILLKYFVDEENILAKETRINGDIYKDSCVEFFVSIPGNESYYNFEFNCIGVPHVGYGPGRSNRKFVDPEILKQIKVRSSLGNQPFEEKTGGHQWEMMLLIPTECLAYDKDIILKGLNVNANFYKCGDETSKPHFVTWNPIGTEGPDYHVPQFFGELLFE
ncbi:MAG: carbohydrate-binding family 9-like protein [Bacteroidota bacterium]